MAKKPLQIVAPKLDLMLSKYDLIQNITTPLRNKKITFFSHTRIFNDGSRIDFNTNPKMAEDFYYHSHLYKSYEPEVNPRKLASGFKLLSYNAENTANIYLRDKYNIDNMLVRIELHDHYCDVWNYGTDKGDRDAINTYINEQEFLLNFNQHYLTTASGLIKKFEKDPIKIFGIQDIAKEKARSNQKGYFQQRTYLGERFANTYLTPKELNVIFYALLSGGTYKSAATQLACSVRTIETHIRNIKNKLKVNSSHEIVKIVISLGLFDSNP